LKYTNHKGQIIIIISLFFAIAILAVAVLAYMTLSKTQTLSYYPYKEIVESINTDFYNALTKILAITTQIYNQTAEIDSPRRNASQLFTFWYKAAQRTYSSKGLNISTSFDRVKLQSSKNIWGVSLPEIYVCNLTKLYWYAPQAISAIEASLYVNSAQYQFYGWKTKVLIFLNATIQLPIRSDSRSSAVSFNLLVFSERGPVNDLTKSNVAVWYFDPTATAGVFPWKKANVTLSYFGNGNYSVTFSPDFYDKSNSQGVNNFWNYYYNFTLVQVEDNRGIMVEAYSYYGIEYIINENAIQWQYLTSSMKKTYGTYLFELLPNGTLYWFEWPLNSGTNSPPIPIPPVKQIRVYVSNKALHVYDYDANGRIVVMKPVSQDLSSGQSFSVAWNAYVTNYSNRLSGVGVVLQNVSVTVTKGNQHNYYNFLFLYSGGNVVCANGTNVAIDMGIPHTYNITITYIRLPGGQKNINAYFYVDSKQVNKLTISDNFNRVTINSVGAGSCGVSSTYDLYVDGVSMINVTGKVTTEDFEDGVDNFFVNTYQNGKTGKYVMVIEFTEVPYQVELWKNDYSFPTPKFAEWRRRLLAGSKIAFLVNFPPGVKQQTVCITWLYDTDVYPPSYKINMSASGPFVDIYNGIYTLRLVAKISFSNWIDYSVSLIGNGYHTEYTFFGYDAYYMGKNNWWLPDKIPGGNWTVLVGPIRAIAFRNSTIVMEYPTKKAYTDELSHSMIISIPYNVTYFTWSFRGKWLKPVILSHSYLTYIGMISGTSSDYGTGLRTNWGSLYPSTESNVVVNGSFSNYDYLEKNNMSIDHRARGLNNYTYGNWLALYRDGFGSTIFASNELINTLKSYNKDQAWIWTTGDHLRRVMEYDAIYFTTSSSSLPSRSFYVKAAGMLYDGGHASNSYLDDSMWNHYYDRWHSDPTVSAYRSSSGVNVPLMYYRMFTGANNPTISKVKTIYTPILP